MIKFLVDACMNQKAVRSVPIQGKGFDIWFPEAGSYKSAVDSAIRKIAVEEDRVLVSVDKDFGINQLQPEDIPSGVIWFRLMRISQRRIGELIQSLCHVLTTECSSNPYDFRGKIVEVLPDRVVIHGLGGITTTHPINPPLSN
jgi:predicted nuclease of predicted toxin-antitoxin system